MKGGDRNLLRDLNVALVSHLLRTYQPISRVELAGRAQLGRSTITEIIGLLMDEGIVLEVGEAESTGGRKPVLLELAPRSRLVAAVRISPRSVSLGLADLNGHLIARHRRALRGGRSADEVLRQVITWVTEMMREYGPDSNRVMGLGLVLPGRVEPESGLLHSWPMLQWEEEPIGPYLTERLGMPVVVESDATAFALGEQRHGGGKADERLLAVTLGAGVGAALIRNGETMRGSTGSMSALGHMQVEPDGPLCWCGQRGCLEAMVSDEAFVARAGAELERGTESLLVELAEGRREALTREMIVAAAQDGDLLCLRLLSQAGEWIGRAL
ncbi:MAG: ROK family protein, partial [Mycobacterium leprae]